LMESDNYIGAYCHGGRIGALVSLDTDNVSLAKDIAMHIAATAPQAVSPEEVDSALVQKEREIYLAQASNETGKSPDIIAKMVEGRIKKYLNI